MTPRFAWSFSNDTTLIQDLGPNRNHPAPLRGPERYWPGKGNEKRTVGRSPCEAGNPKRNQDAKGRKMPVETLGNRPPRRREPIMPGGRLQRLDRPAVATPDTGPRSPRRHTPVRRPTASHADRQHGAFRHCDRERTPQPAPQPREWPPRGHRSADTAAAVEGRRARFLPYPRIIHRGGESTSHAC